MRQSASYMRERPSLLERKQSLLCAFLYNYMYVTTVYRCSNIFKLQLLSIKPRDLVPRMYIGTTSAIPFHVINHVLLTFFSLGLV